MACIFLQPVSNEAECQHLLLMMNNEKVMALHNRHQQYSYNAIVKHIQSDKLPLYFLIMDIDNGVVIGYFEIFVNPLHLSATVNMGIESSHILSAQYFAEAFLQLTAFLKKYYRIGKITLPITGVHDDLSKIILGGGVVELEATLAQESMDLLGQRQPVTYYAHYCQ